MISFEARIIITIKNTVSQEIMYVRERCKEKSESTNEFLGVQKRRLRRNGDSERIEAILMVKE